ncbi:DUF6907 domain-containing protein [Leifsonia sp. P73]|uniref:DUF6907 domain-containing protein n=1 Tax=Leifsonia sp. P73 TaxID=3423959 RepID=UPI003DA5E719
MSEEIVPCPVVPWCTGHPQSDIERMAWDDIVHEGEPETLLDLEGNREDLLIERQTTVKNGREFYFIYGDVALEAEVDELEALAASFELAAKRLRDVARADSNNDDRRV